VLFEADDSSSLTDALERALELGRDPQTAAACRMRASEFDWSRVVERYEAVYRSVLEPGSSSLPSRPSVSTASGAG
jgi:glycogen synthase